MKERDFIRARMYAKAFLNVWPDAINPQLLERLTDFAKVLHKERRLFFILSLPHLGRDIKAEQVKQFCERLGLPWQFERLVNLLLADQRIFLLPEIVTYICQLYARQHNIVRVKIKSSVPLKKEECEILTQFLGRCTGSAVQYQAYVDSSLIAGIRIESDRVLWEHSAQQQLRSVAGAGYHIEGAHE